MHMRSQKESAIANTHRLFGTLQDVAAAEVCGVYAHSVAWCVVFARNCPCQPRCVCIELAAARETRRQASQYVSLTVLSNSLIRKSLSTILGKVWLQILLDCHRFLGQVCLKLLGFLHT